MSFLRRLLGGGGGRDEGPPAASGSPDGPVAVSDPVATLSDYVCRLAARPELEFLIVVWDEPRNRYLQFTPRPDGAVVAEAVGDRYLEPRYRLSDGQRAGLRDLGWQEDAAGGNWQRTWQPGTEPHAIAEASAAAMAVYGTRQRADWTITFGAD